MGGRVVARRRRGSLAIAALVAAALPLAPRESAAAQIVVTASPRAQTCTSSVGPGIPPPGTIPSGQPGFHASWYGQSGYPTLCPGDRSTAVVAFYNTGSRGWVNGRLGEVAYLGTWGPDPGQDRASALGGDGTAASTPPGRPRDHR